MYSYEIDNLLRLRNYLLENKEYLEIVLNSPQIRELTYSPYSDDYDMSTYDNYHWRYKVKKYEEE